MQGCDTRAQPINALPTPAGLKLSVTFGDGGVGSFFLHVKSRSEPLQPVLIVHSSRPQSREVGLELTRTGFQSRANKQQQHTKTNRSSAFGSALKVLCSVVRRKARAHVCVVTDSHADSVVPSRASSVSQQLWEFRPKWSQLGA